MTTRVDRSPDHAEQPPAQSGVNWLGAAALKLHAVMVLGVAGSVAAAWFEWTRALSGHELAWAYSFEWPIFALMGIYLWWRLLHQSVVPSGVAARVRRGRRGESAALQTPVEDPELAAWEAYLARLHAADPPGGPPARKPA